MGPSAPAAKRGSGRAEWRVAHVPPQSPATPMTRRCLSSNLTYTVFYMKRARQQPFLRAPIRARERHTWRRAGPRRSTAATARQYNVRSGEVLWLFTAPLWFGRGPEPETVFELNRPGWDSKPLPSTPLPARLAHHHTSAPTLCFSAIIPSRLRPSTERNT